MDKKFETLAEKLAASKLGGGQARIDSQHKKGLTAGSAYISCSIQTVLRKSVHW
ncbi:MAG: hypothetical protein R2778_01145 [Saprospiraceae bacterium]